MAAPTESLDDLFTQTVKGRYKLAEGTSSAKFWAPKAANMKFDCLKENPDGSYAETKDYISPGAYVPRPDRSSKTLFWLSLLPTGLLGVDHFYLRSPGTGIAKLLTLGGFGLWYLWDLLQVSFEKDRVLNYGMSTPFDILTGIGQGMITDQETQYKQEVSFFGWILSVIFGFTGADMFTTSQTTRGFRTIAILIFGLFPLIIFLPLYYEKGLGGAINEVGYVGTLTTIFWFVILAFGIFSMWGSHLHTLLFDPKDIMEKGLRNPLSAVKLLNWYDGMFVDENGNPNPESANAYKVLKENFAFNLEGTTGKMLSQQFWIGRNERVKNTATSNKTDFLKHYWLIFRQVFVVIGDWLKSAFCFIFPGICKASAAASAVASAASGESPGIPIPGKANLTGSLPKVQQIPKGLQIPIPGGLKIGGARDEGLSTEAKIIGATLAALIGGGALKGLVDFLVPQ